MLTGMADKITSQETSDAVSKAAETPTSKTSDALLELVRLLARQAAREHVIAPSEIIDAPQD